MTLDQLTDVILKQLPKHNRKQTNKIKDQIKRNIKRERNNLLNRP